MRLFPLLGMNYSLDVVSNSSFLEYSKRTAACYLSRDARAGIRTRVGGMKTHYDGPGYTTRATANPPTTP